MESIWFALLATLITAYVVLDGFDLGAGAVHWWVGRNEDERAQVLRSIGPVWDGNEVCLIAAGGTLFLAFPRVYAAGFSGFYLPLMVALWLLVLRGIAIELRGHLDDAIWRRMWDAVFAGASVLLAVCLGAALGNVVRGVPIDTSRSFFTPLWASLGEGSIGVFDAYTLLVGVTALLALSWHGSHWIAHRTDGVLRDRSRQLARVLWGPVVLVSVALSFVTFFVQPQVGRQMRMVWPLLGPVLAIAGLAFARVQLNGGRDGRAFAGSAVFLVGLMVAMAAGIYPYLLPSTVDPALGLTVDNAAASANGLRIGLRWWIPGMLLVTGYFVFLYRQVREKVGAFAGYDAH
ncbi:MAG: cytochrome d ubiquinol oxidase subunit II [Candidatus Eisenbacteria bacterium]